MRDIPVFILIKVDLMNTKEIKKRMRELEVYLNLLTTNKVVTSTEYFAKFLGLSLKVNTVIIGVARYEQNKRLDKFCWWIP